MSTEPRLSRDGTPEFASRPLARRSFLRGLGATLAAGLGITLLPEAALAAGGRGTRRVHPDVCALYCYPSDCAEGMRCSSGQQCFRCTSDPCQYTTGPYCDSNPGPYCASTTYC